MPLPLLVAAAYWLRIARRPIDVRLKLRHLGGFTVTSGAVSLVGLWLAARPAGIAGAYFWGELAGVLALYLMCCSLLLATRLSGIEPYFGGLDRMYTWHRRTGLAGLALLAPHKLILGAVPDPHANPAGVLLGVISAVALLIMVLISLPRFGAIVHLPYRRWLIVHRFTGVLVVLAALHGLLVDRILAASTSLRVTYLLLAAAGIAAYGYALIRRRLVAPADYTVATVTRPEPSTLEITLTPIGQPTPVTPGQFIFLSFGGDDAWREHPFSISAAHPDGRLRLSIRALGADTRRLQQRLQPGTPAKITGPYGMFDYTLGGPRQIWIGGGIGIAPFLGWLRALTPNGPTVDLLYSTASPAEAIYLPEITSAATHLPNLTLHTVYTDTQRRLTPAAITAHLDVGLHGVHVFLCGPAAMTQDLTRGLRHAGIPRDHLHSEHFSFR